MNKHHDAKHHDSPHFHSNVSIFLSASWNCPPDIAWESEWLEPWNEQLQQHQTLFCLSKINTHNNNNKTQQILYSFRCFAILLINKNDDIDSVGITFVFELFLYFGSYNCNLYSGNKVILWFCFTKNVAMCVCIISFLIFIYYLRYWSFGDSLEGINGRNVAAEHT